MGKVTLGDIVSYRAFEDAGKLYNEATGMNLSYINDRGEILSYPEKEHCAFCSLIQSTPEGRRRCLMSTQRAAEQSIRNGKPISYTCHAGLIDVVVPILVAGERVGCFYSGKSLLSPPTSLKYQDVRARVADLDLDFDCLWDAYQTVCVVDSAKLKLAMGLLSVICTHLVEGTMVLRKERELTREQRKLRHAAEAKANLERDMREMEMRLVQVQLNPHFLFNTLNLIQWAALTGDPAETSKLVEDLAVLLRNALADIGSLVPLRSEIESLLAYVSIFKARFQHAIDLHIAIPDEFREILIPPMIVQPIIENALVHALPRMTTTFRLEVTAVSTSRGIELRIADNGPGIDQQNLLVIQRSLRSKKHGGKLTGLRGVHRRLKSYFPQQPGLRLENTGNGHCVTLILPRPTSSRENVENSVFSS